MASEEILHKTLRNADGKPFAKYKGITNFFTTEAFELLVDEVQNDRAGHSRMRVRVPMWRFWESARTYARSPIPKTDGGIVYIPRPGQEILERGSITVTEHYVEASFTADLPSSGGKVNALAAEELIFGRIGRIVAESLMYRAYKPAKLYNHIHTADNAEFIRSMLPEMGLVAFVAAGSVLPRRDDDLAPMTDAVPFDCDGCMKVTMAVPHGDPIVGLGIKSGFTVIAGCSRAGKSVLLDAIMAGVHNHIPGDGREYVVTVSDAAYIMSEAGRPADAVDVSSFLPGEENTKVESPSVPSPMSELVAVSEAVEMGSRLILIDEEYSNPCIIRRGFLAEDDELVPISELGRSMGKEGVSVIMVTGDRSAAELADRVFRMDGYNVSVASVETKPSDRVYTRPNARYPVSKNIVFEKGRKEVSTSAQGVRTVEIGEYKVNVPVSGLFDTAQTRAVADAIVVAKDLMDGSRSMSEVCRMAVDAVMAYDPENGGSMHRARPRPMDLAAVLNRHPQMLCIQKR